MAKHKRFHRRLTQQATLLDDVYANIYKRDHKAIHSMFLRGRGYIVSQECYDEMRQAAANPISAIAQGVPVTVSSSLPFYSLHTRRSLRRAEWMRRKRERERKHAELSRYLGVVFEYDRPRVGIAGT